MGTLKKEGISLGLACRGLVHWHRAGEHGSMKADPELEK